MEIPETETVSPEVVGLERVEEAVVRLGGDLPWRWRLRALRAPVVVSPATLPSAPDGQVTRRFILVFIALVVVYRPRRGCLVQKSPALVPSQG